MLSINAIATTCDEVLDQCTITLNACDGALKARKKEVRLCSLGLVKSQDVISKQDSVIQDQQDSLNSIWRNPFFIGLIGFSAGVIVTAVVIK